MTRAPFLYIYIFAVIRLLTHEHNPCDSAYHYTGVPSFVNKPYINACVLVHVAAAIYTVEEVAKHNSKTDCWIIVEGGVYDITEVRNNGERVRSNHRMCLFFKSVTTAPIDAMVVHTSVAGGCTASITHAPLITTPSWGCLPGDPPNIDHRSAYAHATLPFIPLH